MSARTPHGRRYGGAHQAARAAALAALEADPATPCCRCGGPMDASQPGLLHLDHFDDGSDGYAGLSHAACNLSAGGRLGQSYRRGWSPRLPEPREQTSPELPPLPVVPDGRWGPEDAERWAQLVARLPETKRWTAADFRVYNLVSAPPGHLRGWCRLCRQWDCPYATAHAPYGHQPW